MPQMVTMSSPGFGVWLFDAICVRKTWGHLQHAFHLGGWMNPPEGDAGLHHRCFGPLLRAPEPPSALEVRSKHRCSEGVRRHRPSGVVSV